MKRIFTFMAAIVLAVGAFADNLKIEKVPEQMAAQFKAPQVKTEASEAQWQEFGTATVSEQLRNRIATNCNHTLSADPIAVDYRIVDENIWEYRMKGFMGKDIILTVDNKDRITRIYNQETAIPSTVAGEEDGFYDNFHLQANAYGTPRDGRVAFSSSFWMLVSPYMGLNLGKNAEDYIDFKSDKVPVFNILMKTGGQKLTDPEDKTVVFDAECSVVPERISVNIYKYLYDKESSRTQYILKETADLTLGSDNTITVPLNYGRGVYMMRFTAYDEVGPFGDNRTFHVYSNMADGHQWTSIGKGLFFFNTMLYYTPRWVEVEMEKATDVEGLYRAVNPIKYCTEFLDAGFEYIEGQDFYQEFGPALDCPDFLPTGYISDYGYYGSYHPVHLESDKEGWYKTNMGMFTLPGVTNLSVVFSEASKAIATPQVKKVDYLVVPSAKAAEYDKLPEDSEWFAAGLDIKTITPDAQGKLTFDLGAQSDKLCRVVVRSYGEGTAETSFAGYVNYTEDGWVKTGTADLTATLCNWEIAGNPDLKLVADVYVNPLNRSHIRIIDPYKPLASVASLAEDYNFDFTADRSVYLVAPEGLPVYSSNVKAEVEECGPWIGISLKNSEYESTHPEYLQYRFETNTNLLLRSNISHDKILQDEYYKDKVPMRYGNMIVFPVESGDLYALMYDIKVFGKSFSFAAPVSFAVTEKFEANAEEQKFTVSGNVQKIRVLTILKQAKTTASDNDISLEGFIADETMGEYINVADGQSEPILRPDGTYDVYAVCYDAAGRITNAKSQEMYLKASLGIDDIITDSDRPAEYYNLQGIRIDSPASGTIVIMRRGDKAVKTLVR